MEMEVLREVVETWKGAVLSMRIWSIFLLLSPLIFVLVVAIVEKILEGGERNANR